MTTQRYFKIVFRLSIVIGVIAALVDANNIRQNYFTERAERYDLVVTSQRTFDCASKLNEAQLSAVRNEYGFYDVAIYGCGIGEGVGGKTFFVSDDELESHRNGNFELTNGEYLDPVGSITCWESNLSVLAFAFFALNLLGTGLYFLFLLGKWIFK